MKQRPSVDISGGSMEMVGGCGRGLIEALKLWEWCLVAQEAAGRQDCPSTEGAPPFSPVLSASASPNLGDKRKTPTLSALDAECEEAVESPGKRVRNVADVIENFSLTD